MDVLITLVVLCVAVLCVATLSGYSIHQQKKILQYCIEPKIDNNIEKLEKIALDCQLSQEEIQLLHNKIRALQSQNEQIQIQNEEIQKQAKEQNNNILSQKETWEAPLKSLKEEIQGIQEYFDSFAQSLSKNFPTILQAYESQINEMSDKLDEYAKWGETKIHESQKETLDSIDSVVRDFRGNVKLIGACLDKIWNYLQNQEEILNDMQYSVDETFKSCTKMNDVILSEYESWKQDPLARKSDLHITDKVILVDFENCLLSIWDATTSKINYQKLCHFFVDPLNSDENIKETIIVFTNKIRWQRKDYFDKKKNITYQDAWNIRQVFQNNGARFIETESNVDIPLTLLAMNLAKQRSFDEFVLIANDSTYGTLLRELSDLGCVLTGVLLGESSLDLIATYKRMGFSYVHIKDVQELPVFNNSNAIIPYHPQPTITVMPNVSVTTTGTGTEEIAIDDTDETYTNPLHKKLLAILRKQGMQFLGATIQDKILRTSHEILKQQGKMELTVLIQTLIKDIFSQEMNTGKLSKTKINGVLAILRRSGCVDIIREDKEHAGIYWQLLENAQNYDDVRKLHDAIFVKLAQENDIVLSPEQWSLFLYDDEKHVSQFSS